MIRSVPLTVTVSCGARSIRDCADFDVAPVSAHILKECLLDLTRGRTRVLVTHHLEAARHADWILVVDNGRIVEQGTFSSIRENDIFRMLQREKIKDDAEDAVSVAPPIDISKKPHPVDIGKTQNVNIAKIHMDEERNTGSISWAVYTAYLRATAAGGLAFVVPLSLIAAEGSQIGNVLFLGFWSSASIPEFDKGHYMGIYAALGFGLAFFTLTGAYSACLAGLQASYTMFNRALIGVLRSPVLFFDRTPSGRIQSR